MPKRTDLQKILVIGSGPIVIGQAAEFDYAGTQACLALKEEGYEVILCNSNPATIMTDTSIADKVYMEPLTLEYISKIVRRERPDAILPGIGGQTGLNLAMQLAHKGVLEECGVELLGTSIESIERAEDRDEFKQMCNLLNEPVLPSEIAHSIEEGVEIAKRIGFPLVLRPAFTLGGTGGAFVEKDEDAENGDASYDDANAGQGQSHTGLRELLKNALSLSPVHQVLVEKSVKGYKEIEYEVMRDKNDTAITVCNMENITPVGIHTGDSLVVCPSQTLSNKEYQMLRNSALKIIRELKIEGGCNVQFALDPNSFQYYLIEINPRVSRSSALASKASGYPIARVSAKICVGMTLDEIMLANTPASFEPALDYVVTKMPRFPFDKFDDASNQLGTQMKATGEVMSVGRSMEESLLKAIRSLETGKIHIRSEKFENWPMEELYKYLDAGTDDRLFAIAEIIRNGGDIEKVAKMTKIDIWFIEKIVNIVKMEQLLASVANAGKADVANASKADASKLDVNKMQKLLRKAKQMGFADEEIARLWGVDEESIRNKRKDFNILPVYKMIDTCASEFESYVPYFYSTYNEEDETIISKKHKIIVLGSGPIRIGQGVEFDYSTVHAVKTIKSEGFEAIIINNNPETVSTDYTCADKLYFEPLTVEDVMNIIDREQPYGVIATLGGQTAINLADKLAKHGANIIGTNTEAIDKAENRDAFETVLQELKIPHPEGRASTNIDDGLAAAEEIGYPVLVRPSFVLGGRAMQIVAKKEQLTEYLKNAVEIDKDKPVLVDKYIRGREVEVDAICDGQNVFVPGIMELVERTGVHSGDSISVYPAFSLSAEVKEKIIDYTVRLGIGIGVIGLYNIQFIVDNFDNVYIIEVNPRSSRTVPFISKATGFDLAAIATVVILGKSLPEQGIHVVCPREKERYYVKVPAFSFAKLKGMDSYLSPEMKSTGEAIGYDVKMHRAIYKAMLAAGLRLHNYGTVIVTLADEDKEEALPLVRRFYDLGFNIEATVGTANYLKSHGIRSRIRKKLSEGSEEILDAIRAGYVSYVINTRAILSGLHYQDGVAIRRCATENNITMLTSLDTVRVLLDVLEETTIGISTI